MLHTVVGDVTLLGSQGYNWFDGFKSLTEVGQLKVAGSWPLSNGEAADIFPRSLSIKGDLIMQNTGVGEGNRLNIKSIGGGIVLSDAAMRTLDGLKDIIDVGRVDRLRFASAAESSAASC